MYAIQYRDMLINREYEMEMLENIWKNSELKGNLVLFVGPQGSGKYTIVKEFANRKKIKFMHYRCDKVEVNIPLGTIRRFLDVYYPNISLRRNVESEKLFDKILRKLEDGKKKIIYFGRLDYADDISLKFFTYFALNPVKGVMLITSYPPGMERREMNEILERLVIEELANIVIVDNLSKEDVEKYLRGKNLKKEEIEKIYKVTEGNLLHINFILKYYEKKGKIKYFKNINDAVTENYKILDIVERNILQIGSVMGNLFFKEVIEDVIGKDIDKELKKLEKDGWIEAFSKRYGSKTYEGYTFVHDAFSSAIYSCIEEKIKKEIHDKIGRSIEKRKIFVDWERVYELANHYSIAENLKKSIYYIDKVANFAFTQKDYHSSVYYLKKYEKFLNSLNDDLKRIWMYHILSQSLKKLGKIEESLLYEDKIIGFSIIKKAEIYRLKGDFKESIKLAKMVRGIDDSYLEMLSYKIEGNSLRRMGLYQRALKSFKKNLELAKNLKNDREVALAYKNMGNVYLSMMDIIKGEKYYMEAMKIFQRIRDLEGISAIYNNMGIVYSNRGIPEKAKEYYQKSLEIDKNLRNFESMGTAYNNIGTIYEELGDTYEAMESYRKSMEYNLLIGSMDGLEYAYSNLASLSTESGKFKEAMGYCKKEIDMGEKIGSVKFRISGYIQMANICYFIGKYEDGIEYAKKAMSIGKKYEDYYDSVDSNYYIAKIYYVLGYTEKCEKYVTKAIEIYRNLGFEDRASHLYSLLAKCKGSKIFEKMEKIVKIYTPMDECEILMAKAIVYAKEGKESRKYYEKVVEKLKNLKKFATLSKFMEEYGKIVGDEKIINEVRRIEKNFEY